MCFTLWWSQSNEQKTEAENNKLIILPVTAKNVAVEKSSVFFPVSPQKYIPSSSLVTRSILREMPLAILLSLNLDLSNLSEITTNSEQIQNTSQHLYASRKL